MSRGTLTHSGVGTQHLWLLSNLDSRCGPKADTGGGRDAPQLTSGATGNSGALRGCPGLGPSKKSSVLFKK